MRITGPRVSIAIAMKVGTPALKFSLTSASRILRMISGYVLDDQHDNGTQATFIPLAMSFSSVATSLLAGPITIIMQFLPTAICKSYQYRTRFQFYDIQLVANPSAARRCDLIRPFCAVHGPVLELHQV